MKPLKTRKAYFIFLINTAFSFQKKAYLLQGSLVVGESEKEIRVVLEGRSLLYLPGFPLGRLMYHDGT